LRALEAQGKLIPEVVVEAAADPRHPLNRIIYKLDDPNAAYQHRLSLAREVISSYRVEVQIRQTKKEVRNYFSTRRRKEPAWISRKDLASDLDRLLAASIPLLRQVATQLGTVVDLVLTSKYNALLQADALKDQALALIQAREELWAGLQQQEATRQRKAAKPRAKRPSASGAEARP
jgi:hypothetical protein